MKTTNLRYPMIALLLAGAISFPLGIHSQESKELIERAFHTKDANLIRPLLADEVELSMADDVEFLTRAACIQRLKDWMASRGSIKVSGQMSGTSELRYYRGMLTDGDRKIKLTLYLHESEGKTIIDEIRLGMGG